jgi:DNA mismatch endonuclease (patch repair protein)
MADVHDPKTRSYNMSRIRGKDTKPELLVRKFLYSQGDRFRLHDKKLPGKPDIVVTKHRTVIFINGCFWHGHEGCKYYVIPKTRTEWWLQKINSTIKRDKIKTSELEKLGWKVFTIWECDLKSGNLEDTLNKLILKL